MLKDIGLWKKLALAFVFIWFTAGGVAHFAATEFFVSIMPPYLPFHYEAVYISAVFEILGALGLLLPASRRLAGWGLILLTLCVSPANVHMWLNPDSYPGFSESMLLARLGFQLVLLWVIWWSTRPPVPEGTRNSASR